MRVYEKQTFSDFDDRDSGAVYSDLEFRECYFESCVISVTEDPRKRSTIRNVKLGHCSQLGCGIEPAIFEDVLVDGFNTRGQLLQAWGAVFNRVVLRGKLGRLMISSVVDIYGDHPELQQAFDEANAEYYRHVDWALDISQGEFSELDIRGVPARLIRRDPATQVVVTREKALEGNWRELPFREGRWAVSLSLLLEFNLPDKVLVAPKRSRKFKDLVADLELLRKAGVAEPD